MITGLELLGGVVLISALAILAIYLRALDVLGGFSGAIISVIALLAGGLPWLLMIIIFVAVSSAMTRYKYEYKRGIGFAQEKLGMRSWPNSLANGGVSVIASVAELYTHSEIFAVMFLASVAAAMSDTLATEVGLLSHSKPKLITHPSEYVEVGTSGGTTLFGNLAALISSGIMGSVGFLVGVIGTGGALGDSLTWLAVTIGSVSGVFFDSFLGATVQEVYKCQVCGSLTESETHHDRPGILTRGVKHFDNNIVNFVGILFGSAVSILIYVALVH